MNNIILFDDDIRDQLLPLSYTRPVADFRIGILTIKEKWEKSLGGKVSYITQDYLADKYPITITDENYVINGSVLPSPNLCQLIKQLEFNEALIYKGELIATKMDAAQFQHLIKNEDIDELEGFEVGDTPFTKINHCYDIFSKNGKALIDDFKLLTAGRLSQEISPTNKVLGRDNIFIEKGASVECSILNATTGPIYIGKNAKILEGCMIRGPLALCEGAVMKMGAKIYGPTTIGPDSKVAGEIKNSVIFGCSNKGHEGYLGNAVIGEWCNIGADTNSSNMKNNYAEVKIWSYPEERFAPTGLQFCGLIMGDHSKCSINTMFNTGTVVGVFANIFGAGFPRNFVPSFSWGGKKGFSTYKLPKVYEVAEKVMIRRKVVCGPQDKAIFKNIFEQSAKYRNWETIGQRND